MNFLRYVSFSLATIICLSSNLSYAAPEKSETPLKQDDVIDFNSIKPGTIVGKIGNKTITVEEVLQAMQALPAQLRQGVPIGLLFRGALDQLIDMNILKGEALKQKAKIKKEPEVIDAIDSATEQIILEFYIRNEIIDSAVSNKAIRARYRELLEKFPKDSHETKVRLIVVPTKEEAEKIIKDVKAGGDFLKFAREKSVHKESAKNDGDIGYLNPLETEKLLPGFDVVFKKENKKYVIKTGDMTQPLKTDIGWCILKIEDRKPLTPLKLKDVREFIRNQLSQEAIEKFTKKKKKSLNIQRIHPNTGKPMQAIQDQLAAIKSQISKKVEEAKKQ